MKTQKASPSAPTLGTPRYITRPSEQKISTSWQSKPRRSIKSHIQLLTSLSHRNSTPTPYKVPTPHQSMSLARMSSRFHQPPSLTHLPRMNGPSPSPHLTQAYRVTCLYILSHIRNTPINFILPLPFFRPFLPQSGKTHSPYSPRYKKKNPCFRIFRLFAIVSISVSIRSVGEKRHCKVL